MQLALIKSLELKHQPSSFLRSCRQDTDFIKPNYKYSIHGIEITANLQPNWSTSKGLHEAFFYKNQVRSNLVIRMLLTSHFNSLWTWSAFVVTTCLLIFGHLFKVYYNNGISCFCWQYYHIFPQFTEWQLLKMN